MAANDPCADSRNLKLVNGKIVTMDKKNSIVTSVTIQNGVFDNAGKVAPCTKVIDLHGRTAVPGLIDNHNHIVALGLRPGHDTRIETAASIADVQELISARAKNVPAGEFLTAMGGWNPAQFKEKRLPTLAELDTAAPDHPVLMYLAFTGPAATNSKGKAFFTSKGVAVSATGEIAANAPSLAALNALRAAQTLDDQKRGTSDAMAYALHVGVTTSADMGVFVIPGTPDVQDSFTFDTLASGNPFRMYDAFLALHRERKMPMRLRVFYLTMDKDNTIPLLTERVLNSFPEFGDDMMRISGIGEFATNWPLFGTVTPAAELPYCPAIRGETRLGFSAAQFVARGRSVNGFDIRGRQCDDSYCCTSLVDRPRAANRQAIAGPAQGDRGRDCGASVRVFGGRKQRSAVAYDSG